MQGVAEMMRKTTTHRETPQDGARRPPLRKFVIGDITGVGLHDQVRSFFVERTETIKKRVALMGDSPAGAGLYLSLCQKGISAERCAGHLRSNPR